MDVECLFQNLLILDIVLLFNNYNIQNSSMISAASKYLVSCCWNLWMLRRVSFLVDTR